MLAPSHGEIELASRIIDRAASVDMETAAPFENWNVIGCPSSCRFTEIIEPVGTLRVAKPMPFILPEPFAPTYA
jgi:hypothetical protein